MSVFPFDEILDDLVDARPGSIIRVCGDWEWPGWDTQPIPILPIAAYPERASG